MCIFFNFPPKPERSSLEWVNKCQLSWKFSYNKRIPKLNGHFNFICEKFNWIIENDENCPTEML